MIDTTDLRNATCQLTTDSGVGTGVFVGADLILTTRHVVEDVANGQMIQVRNES